MKSSFNNARIGTRLGAGFGILVVLLCLIGIFAAFQSSRMNDSTVQIADEWLPSVKALGKIQLLINDVRSATLSSLLEVDAKSKQTQHAQHDQALAQLRTAIQDYQKLVRSPEEAQLTERIQKALDDYLALDGKVLDYSESNDDVAAMQGRLLATGDSAAALRAMLDLVAQDVSLNTQGSDRARAQAAATYRTSLIATGAWVLFAVVFGVAVSALITRSIVHPLRKAVSIAETVAQGDLTSHIDVSGHDETAQLLGALKHMNASLAGVIGKVRASSESIATGAAQIATGNTDLSSRTEEQAASLEETASSIEELTATVRQNAESAKQGNTLAISASEVAARGGEVVGRVVDTMQEISGSSAKVAEIINVIEGIAFQTNILALNAAVEAARAGEQGRGFAVVAAEVRTLAQRSAAAAKEIKELITASVERVSTGAKLVDEAGQTIDEVVRSVRRVTDLMGEIAAASTEQQAGIEQVSQAVTQMDQVTQQNAALVEQASAAAQSMSHQAQGLREAVVVFKVNGGVALRVEPARRVEPALKVGVAQPAKRAAKPVAAGPGGAAQTPVKKQADAPVKAATASVDWETF